MVLFIASTILDFNTRNLVNKNNFINLLKSHLKDINNVLFITSYPNDKNITYEYANSFKNALLKENIKINNFYILENDNKEKASFLLKIQT